MLNKEMIEELSLKLDYRFKDEGLLKNALTHSSYVNENKLRYCDNNERLEFLGDAVLDAVISEYLYEKMKQVEEGTLTKQRAVIVCEPSLSLCAKKLGLGKYLLLGKGEEHNGGRERTSMIADAVEAILGAIFIDGGWEAAKNTALHILSDVIKDASVGKLNKDYKSLIQERFQASGDVEIVYEVVKEEGPDHDKTFFVDLLVNGTKVGSGMGKSKKEAEQNAAKSVGDIYNA